MQTSLSAKKRKSETSQMSREKGQEACDLTGPHSFTSKVADCLIFLFATASGAPLVSRRTPPKGPVPLRLAPRCLESYYLSRASAKPGAPV